MALDAAFDELLGHISDPSEQSQMRTILEKYEPVRGGFLRQSDYSRLANESRQATEKATATVTKWQKWADENVPIHENLMKQYGEQVKANEDLKKQVEAASKGEVNVDEATLMQRVDERLAGKGFVSKEEMAKIVSEEAVKLTDQFVKNTLPASMEFTASLMELGADYKQEFGEKFNRQEFAKFMVDRNMEDPQKAYAEYVAPKLNAKAIEDAKQKAVDDYKKTQANNNVPGTGAVPLQPSEMGPVQVRIQAQRTAEAPVTGTGGFGTGAAAAAAALREEGKV